MKYIATKNEVIERFSIYQSRFLSGISQKESFAKKEESRATAAVFFIVLCFIPSKIYQWSCSPTVTAKNSIGSFLAYMGGYYLYAQVELIEPARKYVYRPASF